MNSQTWITSSVAAAVACALAGCGGGSAAPTSTAPVQATQAASATQTVTTSGYVAAIAAARKAAATDPLCDQSVMGDFYWEIGGADSTAPIVSHSEGTGSVTADSRFNVASASKFIFGAYVLQKLGIDAVRASDSLSSGLRFLSGYTGFSEDACAGTTTVGACFTAGMGGRTDAPDPTTVDKFDYDGGHDQKLAAKDLQMADTTPAGIDQEYRQYLGLNPTFTMAALDPIMAGGMMGSATDYAAFLRKVMNQQLVIGQHLGDDSVCTLWSACPGQVAYSPIAALNEPWRYSYNHWVESEHGNGTVDAYSSPGKWGFYPWITPDRKYYGIVSRHDTHPDAYGVSVKCGRQIRKAFLGAL